MNILSNQMYTAKKESSCYRSRAGQRLSPLIRVLGTSHKISLNLIKVQLQELNLCTQLRSLEEIHEITQTHLHKELQIVKIMKQHSKLKLILKAHKNKFKPD